MKSESIVVNKINTAFDVERYPDNHWISENPYIFEEIAEDEATNYIGAYMVYVLNDFRKNPDSVVYMNLIFSLNEYSKSKSGLWLSLNIPQRTSVLAFLQHLLHNQPANIDAEEILKIIGRFSKVT